MELFFLQREKNTKVDAQKNQFLMNMEIATNFEVVKLGQHKVDLQVNP